MPGLVYQVQQQGPGHRGPGQCDFHHRRQIGPDRPDTEQVFHEVQYGLHRVGISLPVEQAPREPGQGQTHPLPVAVQHRTRIVGGPNGWGGIIRSTRWTSGSYFV